jgi:hypothetical protein
MKTLLLILSVALFASCSTAYKSGQTPDDLYYSKPKVISEEKVEKEVRDERTVYNSEDRQIRMAIRDQRWRNLDYDYDYDYSYSPYKYGYNYGYYYNPVYYPYPVYNNTCTVKYSNPKNTTIRTANLGGYNNTVTTYSNTKLGGNVKTVTVRGYNNNQQPTRSTNTRTYETRTYNPPAPSNNNSSSGSSAPASGTAVPMPSRGGR